MKITVSIEGEALNSKLAARQLRLIADQVRSGTVAGSGYNVEYDGEFEFDVDFDLEEHTDYWDGEHNHLHVDAEGVIISRQGPDHADGTTDIEQIHEKGIKIADWAKDHGGITPFDTPEAHGGHDH